MTGITTKELKEGTKKYFYYRCDTDGCKFENKNTRAKVVVDFAMKFLGSKPFSNFVAFEHYKKEMERVSKERLKQVTEQLRTKKSALAKAEDRQRDLQSAMVLEKDEEMKAFQKDDFHKTTDHIIELGEEIERLEKEIESVKGAILTYEEFLELFDNMANLLAKDLKMKDLDTILKKVFLNFTVNKKSVEEYTLNEPFASLEVVEPHNSSLCAR